MATSYFINFTDPEKTPFAVNAFTANGTRAPNSLELHTSAIAASTSLLMYGKGHPEYGERVLENIVNVMENFSGASEPVYPTSGQTWFARLTYVVTAGASPATAAGTFWRWDDSTEMWIELNDVGAGPATSADDIVTNSDTQPLSFVDGSFWVDWNQSPAVPELYLGVNNVTSNISAGFIRRTIEDLRGIITDPNAEGYRPQKQLKVYDGIEWKNASAVYSSAIAPQAPAEGDLWFGGSPASLSIYINGAWTTVSTGITLDTFVNTTGDTMTGNLVLTGGADINLSGTGQVVNMVDPVNPQDAATKAYVDLATNNPQVAINQANIDLLQGGGSPEAKVNRSGDTMTGDLNIEAELTVTPTLGHSFFFGGSPIALYAGNHLIRSVSNPVLAQDAATKGYVDTILSGIGSPDGKVLNLTWNSATQELTLISSGSPSILSEILTHTHTTETIDHTVQGSALRDLFYGSPPYPIIPQSSINEALAQTLTRRINVLEAPVAREVFVVGSPQTTFTFTEADYVAGANALQVYVNGVKQYANERAYQKILLAEGTSLTSSTALGLGTYTLRIAVDGAAPSVMSAEVTMGSPELSVVGDIIDQINLDIPTVTAVWDAKNYAIVVYSNATGAGSEIEIIESGSPTSTLLTALTATMSPALYVAGNIVPAAGGPVSMITQNLAYREAVGMSDAAFGDTATTIIFNSPLSEDDVVEMIAFSR